MIEKNRRILIVEDSAVDEMLTLRALKQCEVSNEIDVVRDGKEALNYLFSTDGGSSDASGNVPALVILDIQLPEVDGLEVLRRIRDDERTKLLPVVILTSSEEERDKIKGYKLGVNSFVRKPLQFSDFIKAVVQLGRYWLVTSEAPFERE